MWKVDELGCEIEAATTSRSGGVGKFAEIEPLARDQTVLLVTEVFDVDVGSQADVVGQIPAVVIRVCVDYDVVGIPVPIIAVGEVEGRDAPVEIVEPEAIRSTAGKMPDVAAAEAPGEVSVLKRAIEMVVDVAAAGVMANPLVAVNVWNVGMASLVSVVACRGATASFGSTTASFGSTTASFGSTSTSLGSTTTSLGSTSTSLGSTTTSLGSTTTSLRGGLSATSLGRGLSATGVWRRLSTPGSWSGRRGMGRAAEGSRTTRRNLRGSARRGQAVISRISPASLVLFAPKQRTERRA